MRRQEGFSYRCFPSRRNGAEGGGGRETAKGNEKVVRDFREPCNSIRQFSQFFILACFFTLACSGAPLSRIVGRKGGCGTSQRGFVVIYSLFTFTIVQDIKRKRRARRGAKNHCIGIAIAVRIGIDEFQFETSLIFYRRRNICSVDFNPLLHPRFLWSRRCRER